MISYYYYDGQLRKYLLQFCNIFTGLKVQTGNGECDVPEFMSVPIRIGSRDRVTAAIEAGNTQNKPISVPMMVANMTNLDMSPNRKGVGVVDKKVYLPTGGVYPDDLRTAVRIMPIPYVMSVELALIASNTQQLHQILEQLLVLFDPMLQIQTSDGAFDWTKLTNVMLTSIANEENYPIGGDRRLITWALGFEMPIYLSTPLDIRDEVVRKISIRYGDLDGFKIDEFDEDGNLIPFEGKFAFGRTDIDGK
jgi:hypothetical protein